MALTRIELECLDALKMAANKSAAGGADWEQRKFEAAMVFLAHHLNREHSTSYEQDMDDAIEHAGEFIERFRRSC